MSTVNVTDTLTPELADRVLALAEEALDTDGVAALSEQPLLRVRHGAPAGSTRFHLLTDGNAVVGTGVVERAGSEPDSGADRKSTRLNSSHVATAYAVFCSKKKHSSD